MISVIIPSYKNPRYLDLCLRSALEHQVEQNEIIVVLDGPCRESTAMLREKYAAYINVLEFESNRGQQKAHNMGVTLAQRERILIVNDDNVFPSQWDARLNRVFQYDYVIAPNQIEPNPSIFPSFHIQNFGVAPESFEMNRFVEYSNQVWDARDTTRPCSLDGQTWPVFMEKKWYMILNGVDENFPSPAVADWDFFLRAELARLHCVRAKDVLFYHFAGAATKRTQTAAMEHAAKEQQSFEYFFWKWGYHPMRPSDTNSARPPQQIVSGVRFHG